MTGDCNKMLLKSFPRCVGGRCYLYARSSRCNSAASVWARAHALRIYHQHLSSILIFPRVTTNHGTEDNDDAATNMNLSAMMIIYAGVVQGTQSQWTRQSFDSLVVTRVYYHLAGIIKGKGREQKSFVPPRCPSVRACNKHEMHRNGRPDLTSLTACQLP